MSRLNLLEETRYEKIPVKIYKEKNEAAKKVALKIANLIRSKTYAGETAVLGLATGATPVPVYAELVRMHKEEELSFKNVITFNLDEYYPMDGESNQSYVRFMDEQLFNHIDIKRENIHIPDGTVGKDEVQQFCLNYENKINNVGGLDLQILGIGRTGHIGFNEPGSAINSGTRMVTLDDLTRRDASEEFGGKENVPRKAITMGIGTILKAREIILMAWGEKKASIVRRAVEEDVSSEVPATFLQLSDTTEFVLDTGAASMLTRFDTPWLVKDCNWTDQLIKKAVIWLSETVDKPILKLTDEDYNSHGMAQLATEKGPAYQINIKIFNNLQHTITGWPGGKPGVDDSQRPERAAPKTKRSIVFSPHPDDDVISMGGTFIRLIDQQHEVHVAYQVSGHHAVWDDDVLRYLEFSIDFGQSMGNETKELEVLYKKTRKFFSKKKPRQADLPEIKAAKAFIRKSEAIAGARFCGLKDDRIHFQDLPFYDKKKLGKFPDINADVGKTKALLQSIKPHQIFAAGDFADPNGTHIICFEIIKKAMEELRKTESWTKDCWVWLYRGAWHEYATHEIEMSVPLSPQEVEKKRLAIFKHQSQKDLPVFPGDDKREFWERAEERNRETAQNYHKLGLANYEAMEAFVRWKF